MDRPLASIKWVIYYLNICFPVLRLVVKYVSRIKHEGDDLLLSNHQLLCRFSKLIHGLEFELKTFDVCPAVENIDINGDS